MGKKTQAAKEAARARRERKRRREEFGEKALSKINKRKKPEILNTALAALEGNPLPRDPWNFKSVLENQQGTPQADRFISIIRRTRRSTIVKDQATVQAVWDLCAIPWIRTVDSWKSKGKKAETRFRSLAAHLTCRYTMPQFLFSAFFMTENRPQYGRNAGRNPTRNRLLMLNLFEYLATGGSVKKAVKEGMLPVPFTKKMCHEFMQATGCEDTYEAIRYAQCKAAGGSEDITRALIATRIGLGTYGPDQEDRLLPVIEWFCRQGMLNPDLVSPLFDYIEHRMRVDAEFTMQGRTVGALSRGMEEWHAELNANRRAGATSRWGRRPPSKFEPCGLKAGLYEQGQAIWTVDEILTMANLRDEGSAMHHCVSSYWYRVEDGDVSIWSLKRDGSRQLTIEVNNTIGAIVQARGKCNKPASAEQRQFMLRWANENRLRVRST